VKASVAEEKLRRSAEGSGQHEKDQDHHHDIHK
jgi:hypothetical protein